MQILNNMKLAYRFGLIVLSVVVGFSIYGMWSFKTLNELKVNGPIYHRIVQGKDLVADILPPLNTSSNPIWLVCSWKRAIKTISPH